MCNKRMTLKQKKAVKGKSTRNSTLQRVGGWGENQQALRRIPPWSSGEKPAVVSV